MVVGEVFIILSAVVQTERNDNIWDSSKVNLQM